MQQVEEINLECRLAASMSEEAVAATHVRMALEAVQTLAEEVTPDEAIMHYVRTFNLGSIDAQLIFRSALAQWAELHPLSGETRSTARPVCPAPGPDRPVRDLRARHEFGLRVMV
jgi:hypothetical protein